MLQDEHHVYRQRGMGLFVKPSIIYNILEKERSTFLSKEWPMILQKILCLKLGIEELPSHIKENKLCQP